MITTDKTIKMFGAENPITIAIALLEELGKADLAKQLFEECEELAHPHWTQDDDLDSTLHFIDDVDLQRLLHL